LGTTVTFPLRAASAECDVKGDEDRPRDEENSHQQSSDGKRDPPFRSGQPACHGSDDRSAVLNCHNELAERLSRVGERRYGGLRQRSRMHPERGESASLVRGADAPEDRGRLVGRLQQDASREEGRSVGLDFDWVE
jgi:hypothetical protein